MTFPSLLRPSFWFNPVPPPFLPWIEKTLFVLLILFLIAGTVALVLYVQKRSDKLRRRIFERACTLGLVGGFVGLLLFGMSYERIPYLSMRIFWIAWAVWIGMWGWKIYQYATITIPSIERERIEREKFTKWLPKRKR